MNDLTPLEKLEHIRKLQIKINTNTEILNSIQEKIKGAKFVKEDEQKVGGGSLSNKSPQELYTPEILEIEKRLAMYREELEELLPICLDIIDNIENHQEHKVAYFYYIRALDVKTIAFDMCLTLSRVTQLKLKFNKRLK